MEIFTQVITVLSNMNIWSGLLFCNIWNVTWFVLNMATHDTWKVLFCFLCCCVSKSWK